MPGATNAESCLSTQAHPASPVANFVAFKHRRLDSYANRSEAMQRRRVYETGGQVYRRYSFLCGPLWLCAGLPHRLPKKPLSAQYLHGSASQPHAEAALAVRRLAGHDIHPRLRLARCNTHTSRLLAINDDRPRAYEHVGRVCPPRSLPVARATLRVKILSARCTRSAHHPPNKLSLSGLRRSSFVI